QIVERSNFFLACSHNFELQTSNFKLSRSARQHPPNRADHSPKILLTQVAPRRQAQSALEKLVGNAASVVRGVFEHRLEMHGLPERTTFDILRFEGQSYIFRCRFDRIVEQDAGQPSVGEAAVYFRLEGNSRNVAQRTLVVFKHRPALTNALVEDAELSTANTRADVAEAVVIADMGVFVVRRRVAGLGSQETRVL